MPGGSPLGPMGSLFQRKIELYTRRVLVDAHVTSNPLQVIRLRSQKALSYWLRGRVGPGWWERLCWNPPAHSTSLRPEVSARPGPIFCMKPHTAVPCQASSSLCLKPGVIRGLECGARRDRNWADGVWGVPEKHAACQKQKENSDDSVYSDQITCFVFRRDCPLLQGISELDGIVLTAPQLPCL